MRSLSVGRMTLPLSNISQAEESSFLSAELSAPEDFAGAASAA